MHRSTPTMMCLAALAAAGIASADVPSGDGVDREPTGERLVRAAELETTAFDVALLGGVEGWINAPGGVSPEMIRGKPVLFAAWDAGNSESLRFMVMLNRLLRKYGDDVVFVGLHADEGWDTATERYGGLIRVPAARDAGDRVFASFGLDDRPDAVLIDRAGNVRMVEPELSQIEKALRLVTEETPEDAAGDLARRESRLAEAEAWWAEQVEAEAALRAAIAEGRAVEPNEAAYAAADWPAVNPPTRHMARDLQGRPLPTPFGVHETWITGAPESMDKRVLLLDFWAVDCPPCRSAIPKLAAIQKQHGDEIAVVGVAGQWNETERYVRSFLARGDEHYYQAYDAKQSVFSEVRPRGIPHVILLSTDGVVRWQGNPHDPALPAVVAQVVAEDPMLEALRAVD